MASKLNITGIRYGKLVAIKRNGFDQSPSRKHIKWDCVCDCGKTVNVRLNDLQNGNVKSCGCLKKLGNNIVHCKSKTKEYQTWARMKDRCYNKNHPDYKDYGGRGILVCDSWKNSFINFYNDMGEKPSKNHSIDRINVNGNYEPANCRWANNKEQSRNKRNNIFYTQNEKKLCKSDWANELNITFGALHYRLKKWDLSKALSFKKEN